ncbi:hypothetical protein Angca_000193 [Angiostrongylus cantonensis]|nr:hypothetical protein Angca_000193 [Angiostrongylus cantonensis]
MPRRRPWIGFQLSEKMADDDDCTDSAAHHNTVRDCANETVKIRALLRLTPAVGKMPIRKQRICKYPDEVMFLPKKIRTRILQLWDRRDPNGDCRQQQRKTRLILLNLHPSLMRVVRPPALRCSLPHFIDRLESDLQVQLRRLWSNYETGQPCLTFVTKQLQILQQHNISPESFNIPPADVFRRRELIRKLKRGNIV